MRFFPPLVWLCTASLLVAAKPDGTLPLVLNQHTLDISPGDQMMVSLQTAIDEGWVNWKAAYETRTDPSAIAAHYADLRQKFIEGLGGLPERTPLNPRVTGKLRREGYRVEKIIFESQPGFLVSAALFLPDSPRFSPPYAGVLVPCGHYSPSKAHDEYQSMGALLALNGFAGLVYDPIDQGERNQSLDEDGRPRFWGTEAHTRTAIQSSLLGLSAARLMIWDGMRALDYLQSRPDVDPARLGITGNSGGGTQTSYLMALDDRIKAAAPSCFIHHLASQTRYSMGDGEQHIYGQVAFGLDHPDYLLMRAPLPVMLLAATHDFFHIDAVWETYRLAQRVYTRLGASEKLAILENDAGHNYNRTQREAAVRWLARWLQGRDADVHEPDLQLFTREEMNATPRGQVLLVPGARSTHDLLVEAADNAAQERRRSWPKLTPDQQRTAVRQLARIAPLESLPAREWSPAWTEKRSDYRAEACTVRLAGGMMLPAVWLVPHHVTDATPVVFADGAGWHDATAPGGRLDALARQGRQVLAIDLRGLGETRQNNQRGVSAAIGTDWQDQSRAYLLGRPYVGLQTEDLLDAVRAAQERSQQNRVDLLGIGEAGVPALHAAFAEPSLFRQVTIEHALRSWDEVARAPRFYRQYMNAVPGALRTYDLPDLAAALGGMVRLVDPTDPLGWSDRENSLTVDPTDQLPTRPGLSGIFFGSPNFSNPQAGDLLLAGHLDWNNAQLHRGNDWAVRWKGFLVPAISGDIQLDIASNENAVLRINGRELARSGTDDTRDGGKVRLVAGQAVACEVDLVRPGTNPEPADGIIRLSLRYRRNDGAWSAVPAEWLRHSPRQAFELEHLLR